MAGTSRPQRWSNAAAKARTAHETLLGIQDKVNDDLAQAMQTLVDGIQEALDKANEEIGDARQDAIDALEELKEIQEEYQDWYDNMPYQLQDGPTGEKLSEVTNIDLDWEPDVDMTAPEVPDLSFELDLDDLESVIDEAENADLPRGFGKD